MDPMKICMVSPFGFQAATTRVRAYNLAKHLAEEGDEVLLLFSGKTKQGKGNLRMRGVGRETKGLMNLLLSTAAKYLFLRKAGEFDIYHGFKALPWASVPTLLARGRKAVIDLDDWETGSALDQGHRLQAIFVRFFEYRLPKYFDGVTVVSQVLKDECIAMGIPEERILELPYGCDIDMFKPMPRDEELAKKIGVENKRVVYVGSICELNLRVLVEAMKKVVAEVPDAVLLAVSPGWDLNKFRTFVTQLGLSEEKFVVLDRQPHELMPVLLSIADVVYAPNRFIKVDEARSPSRIGEYMAAGKPIVANAVGVVKEQLSNGGGSLVYSYDPRELASRIIEILQDRELAKKMGMKAREKAEKIYSWSILARKLREFYVKIGW